ncbi:MAG: hypothetical protein BWY71_02134 [Planctomycetes bacterium ADurb.Bin412]|nr:MAG: hypothetical protein BWY71_02134 [Planctomycetes bacterium ADurb.Bin412]
MFQPLSKEQPGHLGQGLHNQDPGHNRRSGKMALEKMFVHGHIFDPDRPAASINLDDPVHQQKRIPVRQDFLNLADIQNRFGPQFGPLFLLFNLQKNLSHQFMIAAMPAAVGDQPPANGSAQQHDIPQQIRHFMPDALIGKPKLIVQRTL